LYLPGGKALNLVSMRKSLSFGLVAWLSLTLSSVLAGDRLNYPSTRESDHLDIYHGTTVPDPYRWLEEAGSTETRAWIEAQNRLSGDYLSEIAERATVARRLTEVWDYEKYGLPTREDRYYFYLYNSGLQNQSALYVTQSAGQKGRLLLDPNQLSSDGTTALAAWQPSRDGRLLAYALSVGGSDWQEWKVRDVLTGEDLVDQLKWTKFTRAAWTVDNQGFFYCRFPAPQPGQELQAVNRDQKVYYHRIGTPQSADRLVYERPDQLNWYLSPAVTEDGRYLILSIREGTNTKNRVFYAELPSGKPSDAKVEFVEFLSEPDAQHQFVGNDGPVFWFLTDKAAPRGRLVAIDIRKPQPQFWRQLIPETPDLLQDVSLVADRFIALYLKDARSTVRIHRLNGRLERELPLPGVGSASGFTGKRSDRETFYSFTSFTTPAAIYRYDLATGKASTFRQPEVKSELDRFETRQVFYQSKDGTRVPMFITCRKDLVLDGSHPTILYGYGGFAVAVTPSFSIANLVWLEMGGVLAVPNLRGGNEYGEAWHEAGRRFNKQNVFDDFIAAAEWLIANRYTSSPKLAIRGGSNGGLLVGACLIQRPELFGAAIPAVGVMDMLRFHKFTVGWGWVVEYGSPDDPEDFRNLHAYSPLHNLKPGTRFPATLITTADHDDRVAPAHSFKFAAAMQKAQAGAAPVLIRIETSAGHGAGKPVSKQIEQTADMWAFLVRTLDFKLPETFITR
jgi:prolyl oligopeptidase